MALLVTVGCDAAAPAAIGSVAPSRPAPIAATTAGPRVTEAVPVPAPTPTAARAPATTASPPTTPAPARRRDPFAMSLYHAGDYVSQYTLEWCVGASLQMTLNMATDRTRTSRASQQQLWEMARDRSDSPFGGANPRGWTAALNDLGVGPYVLVSIPDLDDALRVAATAMRRTNRPVGLVMWRGRHAWVMSGFEFDRRSGERPAGDGHRRPGPGSTLSARQLGVGSVTEAEQPALAGHARQTVRRPRPWPRRPGSPAGLPHGPADRRERSRAGGLRDAQSPGPNSRVSHRSSGLTEVGAPSRTAAEPGASDGSGEAPGPSENGISRGPPRP